MRLLYTIKIKVIEATVSAVVLGRINWTNAKRTVWGVKVKGTSVSEGAQAANWAYRQREKRYKYIYYAEIFIITLSRTKIIDNDVAVM